jgi:hypothetical protein
MKHDGMKGIPGAWLEYPRIKRTHEAIGDFIESFLTKPRGLYYFEVV